MRPSRLIWLGLLALVLTALLVFWPWVDAQRRALIVLATASETPVLSWAVRIATPDPKVEETIVGGVPATIARPAGHGPWPAVVLVAGIPERGRFNPVVQRLARSLARAGLLVIVPELAGADGALTAQAPGTVAAVAAATADRPDARDGRVSLVGASADASIALLAAEDPAVASQIGLVVGLSPYGALPNILRLATTGFYLDEGRAKPYPVDARVALVVGRSLASALPAGQDRTTLLQALDSADAHAKDPLAAVRDLETVSLGPEAAALVRLLANRHPTIFDGLYASLPVDVQDAIERLSPLVGAAAIQARVELVAPSRDPFIPLAESRAIVRTAPNAHLTVTDAAREHGVQLTLTGVLETVRLNGFLVRVLKELAE